MIVDWDGPDDPENPKNWTFKRKWAATAIVSLFTFISPVSSSMIAPASSRAAQDFGVTNTVLIAMMTSSFILAYGFGPLLLSPLSEIYGRSRVLQCANLFYLIWNLVCGFAQNETQLIIFRFLAGLGGSAPLGIGGGVLGDTWIAEERGKAIAVYSLAPLMGPVVGPVAGAWIAQLSDWQWVFWSTSIVDAVIQIAGLFYLRETYAPVLLERKAKRIRKSLASDPEKRAHIKDVRTVYDDDDRTWRAIFAKAMTRPFALLSREPIAQVIAVYMAYIYGTFYLFLTTLPNIFEGVYGQPAGIAGINYVAIGIGLTSASQLNARYMDRIYVKLKNKNGGVGRPEFRVPSMIIGSLILPIGLFLSGWAAQKHLHWVVVDVGLIFIGAGVILNFQAMQTYVVDCYTLHAASALAAVSLLRCLAGFGFPLFAPAMYNRLGYGLGASVLGIVSVVIGWPAPLVFWKFGEAIRKKSKYAK
ncbi:MFS polyamine transporter [Marasmius fiardii PR-910]|nr:MFS polyamine transporter [Marasmius fiardii PR-910]